MIKQISWYANLIDEDSRPQISHLKKKNLTVELTYYDSFTLKVYWNLFFFFLKNNCVEIDTIYLSHQIKKKKKKSPANIVT